MILVSHDHYDHCSPEDIAKIQGPQTVIVTEADSAKKLSGDLRVMKPGDSLKVGDLRIKAVRSYNTDKSFHPRANDWLGFVLDVGGVSVYHAGDSDHIPEMAELDVDIALLPVSGTYVMTASQAVGAAQAINLGWPSHALRGHCGQRG